jgi:hypothetical protein
MSPNMITKQVVYDHSLRDQKMTELRGLKPPNSRGVDEQAFGLR